MSYLIVEQQLTFPWMPQCIVNRSDREIAESFEARRKMIAREELLLHIKNFPGLTKAAVMEETSINVCHTDFTALEDEGLIYVINEHQLWNRVYPVLKRVDTTVIDDS